MLACHFLPCLTSPPRLTRVLGPQREQPAAVTAACLKTKGGTAGLFSSPILSRYH